LDILKYFNDVNAQKQINCLAKKYKNKKIVIYGAGEYFKTLYNNFNLSELNIVGISDKKFEDSKKIKDFPYPLLAPNELKDQDYDAIFVALYDDVSIRDYIIYELLVNTKNEKKPVISIIEPTLRYICKIFIGI